MESEDYLKLIFDASRIGFGEIASKIALNYLDYNSFISLKRSCKFFYQYFAKHCHWEDIQYRRKVSGNWKNNEAPSVTQLPTPNAIKCAKTLGKTMIMTDDSRIYVLVGDAKGFSSQKILHKSKVTCLEVFEHIEGRFLVTGTQNGILSIWEMKNDFSLICEKQLFGCLTEVKFALNFLVTSHTGKDFDVGSVSVRRCDSLIAGEIPVVFSMFGELFPVCQMDFNSNFLALLEWSGTFNGIDVGNINLYGFLRNDFIANLSELSKSTFSSLKLYQNSENEDHIFTGGDDFCLRIWTLGDFVPKCQRLLKFENMKIVELKLSFCCLAVSDQSGNVSIWDVKKLTQDKQKPENDSKVLRQFSPQNVFGISDKQFQITGKVVAFDDEKLVINSRQNTALCIDVSKLSNE